VIVDGMLRRHPQQDLYNDRGGFSLAIQQEVLNFICVNGRRMKKLSLREAVNLAMTRRDHPRWEAAWQERLSDSVLRPALILPDETPRLLSPTMRRAAQSTFEPEPEPPAPQATPPAPSTPEPPAPEPPAPAPEPSPDPDPEPTASELNAYQQREAQFIGAIRTVQLMSDRTCAKVADALAQYPLAEWDVRDISDLGDELLRLIVWSDDRIMMGHQWCMHDDAVAIFADDDGVLQWEDERLQKHSWEVISQRIAPAVAQEAERRAKIQRQREAEAIIDSRLPPKRKLKAMRDRIERWLALGGTVSERGQQIIDRIKAMTADDPAYADCITVRHYLLRAMKSVPADDTAPQQQGSPSIPQPPTPRPAPPTPDRDVFTFS